MIKYITLIIAFFLCFRGVAIGSPADHYTLKWYEAIQDCVVVGKHEWWRTSVVVCALLFAIMLLSLYMMKKTQKITLLCCYVGVLFMAAILSDCKLEKRLIENYRADIELVNEIAKLNTFFENGNYSDNVLFITRTGARKELRYLDTYFLNAESYRPIRYDSLDDEFDITNTKRISEMNLCNPITERKYLDINEADYIIWDNSLSVLKHLSNVEIIDEVSGDNFTLFINEDSNSLKLVQDSLGKETTILFYGQNKADAYVISGMAKEEKDFTWSNGKEFTICVPGCGKFQSMHVELICSDTFNGAQQYIVYNDDKEIICGEINGAGVIEFDLPVNDSQIEFTVKCPDACSPHDFDSSNKDVRRLAFQVKEMKIIGND